MNRVGLYFTLLQLFFTLTWTVYVIFLPRLAVEAGLPASWVVWILFIDQVVFLLSDWAMGLAADRIGRTLGRLGLVAALVSAFSALAFLCLPLVAPGGNPALFLAVTLLWTLTSSALRAPPLMLLGKHAAPEAVPGLASYWLFGLGVAGAVSPYLTVVLRQADPRLPFALAAVALAVSAWGLRWAEAQLAAGVARTPAAPSVPGAAPDLLPAQPRLAGLPAFLGAVACAGFAFQVHVAINSVPGYLRFAEPEQLDKLMPVFWVGFNLCLIPIAKTIQRRGAMGVLTGSAMIAAIAVFGSVQAGSLNDFMAAQFAAGACWAALLAAMFGAILAFGRTGREGLASGGLHSTLALAAALRIGIVLLPLHASAAVKATLAWLPPVSFLAAAVLFSLALSQARGRVR